MRRRTVIATDPWDLLASEKPDFATPIEATKEEFSHLPDHTQYHLVLQLIAECEAAKSCASSDDLRLVRRFAKGGSGSSGVRV